MNTSTNTITEQLGHILIRNAEKAERGLDSAIDFTLQQAPLLCQEYIWWKIACSVAALVILLGVLLLLVFCIRWAIRANQKNPMGNPSGVLAVICCVVVAISLIPCSFELPSVICDGLQAAVAPRVALIELGRSLIK